MNMAVEPGAMDAPAGLVVEFPAAEESPSPSFFEWTEVFPQLQVLIDNYDTIKEEAEAIAHVSFQNEANI